MVVKEIVSQPVIEEAADRRLDFRLKVDIPVQIEMHSGMDLVQISALASQLSKRGIAIYARQTMPRGSEVIVNVPLPGTRHSIQLTARVAWASPSNGGTKHGIQVLHIPSIHQFFFNKFLSSHLISSTNVHERRSNQNEIISELIEFRNKNGKRIVGFYDHPARVDINAPILIIPSAYGETKSNSIHIAYYLAKNGFNAIRFDPTNHVGESEGEHLDYTLPNLKDDIISAIDYVKIKFPKAKMGIVAASLAARAAFKVVREDIRPSVLISLAGVVNTQHTLHMVQNVDLIGTHIGGKIWGTINVAGFDVKADNFLGECVLKSFHNLESTRMDLLKANCPVVFLGAQKDPWVDISECKQVVDSIPHSKRELFYVSGMHRLKENPGEAKKAFRIIVESAARHLKVKLQDDTVAEPRIREIGVQARLERERSRHLSTFTKEEEGQFWSGYLKRFNYIFSVADYRDLLDLVYSEFGAFRNNDMILDAGCGNGNFGLWLLTKFSERCEKSGGTKKIFLNYTGTDIVMEALLSSRKLMEEAQLEFRKKLPLARDFMATQFQRLDMNLPLPFLNDSFDKICSNLVISYLENPVFALRELIRVLKPGGKLVVTSLKKDSDVSQIYRNFIEKASSEIEIEEARNLLSNAGKILLKESEGYFHFYTIPELQKIVSQAYPNCLAKYQPCFANQAVLATITK